MATSSFTKDFTLQTKKAADSFASIIALPAKSLKIDRSLVSSERKQGAKEKLKQLLR